MNYDVFISYSSQDQKIVERICGYLEARGIRCFVAYRDIPRGVVWARAIVEALDNSRMMVVAFSDNFNRSEQVDREIELASEDHKPILTFRLNDTKFEGAKKYYLKNLNWIDAFPNPDEAFQLLYDNICRLLDIERSDSPNNIKTNQASTPTPTPTPTPSSTTFAYDISISKPDTSTPTSSRNSEPVDLKSTENEDNRINGHRYVDLGLPSGLKWAVCNLGATKREEYGDYFAWGETEPKKTYTDENSITYGKSLNWLNSNGYIDNQGNLSLNHDAARKKWGGSWRMPTRDEIKELLSNTVSKFGSINGVKGRILKSRINGARIFIPASGFCLEDELQYNEEWGNIWSSTPYTEDDINAFHLSFNSEEIGAIWSERNLGFTIRPVSD